MIPLWNPYLHIQKFHSPPLHQGKWQENNIYSKNAIIYKYELLQLANKSLMVS